MFWLHKAEEHLAGRQIGRIENLDSTSIIAPTLYIGMGISVSQASLVARRAAGKENIYCCTLNLSSPA